MSKKLFLQAIEHARNGRVEDALALLLSLERGFVIRRIEHYKKQPDQREAAFRLQTAFLKASPAWRHGRDAGDAPALFEAPLPPATVAAAPRAPIDFDHAEAFLSWVSGDWDRLPPLDLEDCNYTDVWALVALGSLRLVERPRRPPMRPTGQGGASRFAHALGLNALSGAGEPGKDEPDRTVRLTRVQKASEIERTADQMASLIVTSPDASNMRLAIRYVLVELLRNVLQHSKDPLGAVAAAQRMDAGPRRPTAMIQLAVADAGIGIPRSLHRTHPHLTDYRQALERALLPHISGTFEEGLTGSFENAGLGLYMISEMARQTGGRLLIATTGAALVLQSGDGVTPASPRFLQPPGVGFPGTLVAFEIPTGAVQDYHALINVILRKANERTPKRAASRWLSFEGAVGEAEPVPLFEIREDTLAALELSRTRLAPSIVARRAVELDFSRIELCTQSWLHALLFEPIRLAWALRVPIHAKNADPAVREGLRFLEAYALGG